MKKSWLFITLLSSTLSVQAQFHTLAAHKPLYKVYETAGSIETKSLPESGEADKPISYVEPLEERAEVIRNHWIERYLSVSYPLKQIKITSHYGQRTDPFTGRRSKHNGLDLRARNEEVYAMMPGEVIKVSSDKRFQPGEAVAISGRTGRATNYHLHITAKHGKRSIDPAILIQFVKETQVEALAHLSGN